MRKIKLTLLIVICFLPNLAWGLNPNYIPPPTYPKNLEAAMIDDNNYLGRSEFLTINRKKDKKINITFYTDNTHMLFYGEPTGKENGAYRYLGENYYGEYITNPDFPDDEKMKGLIEEKDWLPLPWINGEVIRSLERRKEPPICENKPYDGDQKYLANIVQGLLDIRSQNFQNSTFKDWTQYVHILQPPTNSGWGMGRMWHKKADGTIWYISVPLAPRCIFDPVVPNLYVKSIDPGTPVETDEVGNAVYKAEIGKKYTATVVFGTGEIRRDLDLALLRPFVAGLHEINGQAYKGKLKKISGNGHISEPVPEYPDRFTEAKSQTISFNAENSEITATFEWTAQRGTTQLIAAINDGQYVPRHHEFESTADGKPADMTDNVKKVPIKVAPPPDLCVKELKLHTVLTEPGQVYTGTVIYALKPGYREKVTAKLGLTHNGYSISSTEGKKLDQSIVVFDPQKPETMIQTFSFKFTGLALGHNSEIVAKIWPQEPTLKDINWQNNTRRVLIKSHVTDIAVTSI
ncbi:Athe_2463 domain-containing protein, partial [Thermincola ferriacetica]|uniref:Athe_2463 domain-containing protein n=1 Tax=Thermincola ferriacetica TaxID=281456 RepID=UPI000ACA9CF0